VSYPVLECKLSVNVSVTFDWRGPQDTEDHSHYTVTNTANHSVVNFTRVGMLINVFFLFAIFFIFIIVQ